VYAFLGDRGSTRGLVVRSLAAAFGFALCCICRASAVLMAPVFGLALLVAVRRVHPRLLAGGLLRQCLLAVLLTSLFVTPYMLVRPPQHHNFWIGYWEGLGDYGTDRGYSWYDRDLKRWLAAQGRRPFDHPRYVSPEDELYVGQSVRRDVLAHPAWFAAVLARRFMDTVSFAKLRPHRAWDGYSIEPPALHYKYTTPVDWVGSGPWKAELPTFLLQAGMPLLISCWAWATWTSRAEAKRRLERRLSLVLAVGAATLALPVLVTTAGGIETEAFALTEFLALSLLVDEILSAVPWRTSVRWPRRPSPAPGRSPLLVRGEEAEEDVARELLGQPARVHVEAVVGERDLQHLHRTAGRAQGTREAALVLDGDEPVAGAMDEERAGQRPVHPGDG
jgi:hypothetical protein